MLHDTETGITSGPMSHLANIQKLRHITTVSHHSIMRLILIEPTARKQHWQKLQTMLKRLSNDACCYWRTCYGTVSVENITNHSIHNWSVHWLINYPLNKSWAHNVKFIIVISSKYPSCDSWRVCYCFNMS